MWRLTGCHPFLDRFLWSLSLLRRHIGGKKLRGGMVLRSIGMGWVFVMALLSPARGSQFLCAGLVVAKYGSSCC